MQIKTIGLRKTRRIPRPGFNDWAEASLHVTLSFDDEDQGDPDGIVAALHSAWNMISHELQVELVPVITRGEEREYKAEDIIARIGEDVYYHLPPDIQKRLRESGAVEIEDGPEGEEE